MKEQNKFQVSYWERTHFLQPADFIIIGSGLVGLNTALELRKIFRKEKITIVEKSFLPYGASTRNAGFACFGSMSEILSDIKTMGNDAALQLVEKRILGIEKIKSSLGAKKVDFKNYGGYELFFKKEDNTALLSMNRMDEINYYIDKQIGIKNCFSTAANRIKKFGFRNVNQMIFNKLEGQIDTGKMMYELLEKARKQKIQIVNGLEIQSIEEHQKGCSLVIHDELKWEAKKVIVCTNAFSKSLLPELEIQPARAQVLITKPIAGLKLKGTYHFDEGYYYFRNINNRVLIGGARNLAFEEESTIDFGITDKIQNQLKHLLETRILPNTPFEVDMRWSGIMAFGKDKTPIVQKMSKHKYVVARLNGMGVALGGILAEEIAQKIKEDYS